MKEAFTSSKRYPFNEIISISIKTGIISHDLVINGIKVMQLTQVPKNELVLLFECLNQYLKQQRVEPSSNPSTNNTSNDEVEKLKQELEKLRSQLADNNSNSSESKIEETSQQVTNNTNANLINHNKQKSKIFNQIDSDNLIQTFKESQEIGNILKSSFFDALTSTLDSSNSTANEVKIASRNFIVGCVQRVRKHIEHKNSIYFQNDIATLNLIVLTLNLMDLVMKQARINEDTRINILYLGLEAIFKNYSRSDREGMIARLLDKITSEHDDYSSVFIEFYIKLSTGNIVMSLIDDFSSAFSHIPSEKMEIIIADVQDEITEHRQEYGTVDEDDIMGITAMYLIDSTVKEIGDISTDKFIRNRLDEFSTKIVSLVKFR